MSTSYKFYGSTGSVYAFDPDQLETAAVELQKSYKGDPDGLLKAMTDTLFPPEALGRIPDAGSVNDVLTHFITGMRDNSRNVGVNVFELAARTVAAANLARQADTQAARIARLPQAK